ncbi:hypothetical protein BHM03_00058369, partial [Ensete ventricosum]
ATKERDGDIMKASPLRDGRMGSNDRGGYEGGGKQQRCCCYAHGCTGDSGSCCTRSDAMGHREQF